MYTSPQLCLGAGKLGLARYASTTLVGTTCTCITDFERARKSARYGKKIIKSAGLKKWGKTTITKTTLLFAYFYWLIYFSGNVSFWYFCSDCVYPAKCMGKGLEECPQT